MDERFLNAIHSSERQILTLRQDVDKLINESNIAQNKVWMNQKFQQMQDQFEKKFEEQKSKYDEQFQKLYQDQLQEEGHQVSTMEKQLKDSEELKNSMQKQDERLQQLDDDQERTSSIKQFQNQFDELQIKKSDHNSQVSYLQNQDQQQQKQITSYFNLQISELAKCQIQFITVLIEKLKKIFEDLDLNLIPSPQPSLLPPSLQLYPLPPDFLEFCDVPIPNSLDPLHIINQLYDNSWKRRHTDPQYLPFVREEENQNDLFKNYSIRASQIKFKLKEYCTSFRQTKGDGNCFYTAFGYQFLLILLLKYDDSQFTAFIKEMKKIKLSMKMNLDKIKFDNEEEESKLLNNFFYRLIKLRSIQDLEDRKEQYTKQFAAYKSETDVVDGQFYGLSPAKLFFLNFDLNISLKEYQYFLHKINLNIYFYQLNHCEFWKQISLQWQNQNDGLVNVWATDFFGGVNQTIKLIILQPSEIKSIFESWSSKIQNRGKSIL